MMERGATISEISNPGHLGTLRSTVKPSPFHVPPWRTNIKSNVEPLLASISGSGRIAAFEDKEFAYKQDDPADALFYVQNGRMKLVAVSVEGKAAIFGLLGEGQFFGEGCLLPGQPRRPSDAVSIGKSLIYRIEKVTAYRLLHDHAMFTSTFLRHMVARANRLETEIIDHVSNSTEIRLARVLLRLADFDASEERMVPIPKISQETLAQMIGASRSRVNQFLRDFRRRGFIEYDRNLRVHPSLLTVIRRD